MFYGEFQHSIDNKGRLILPSKVREVSKEFGIEKFFLTRGLDKCIFMFAETEWKTQEQKFKSMSFTKQQTRSFNRLFFSGAVDVVPDKQGRFVIPSYLKDYAGIDREVIIIGVANRLEIWDRKSWEDFYTRSSSSFEQIAEDILNI
ncbi:MAG TPA: division/cell wall cluster transcriptional repressor MraZ [Candidatus Omnitrophota bacterium]|nr:division/cell wall cluster transcriptional repressor MraZ [Candidatus Omnitrophota bacterium]HPN88022.1 division/cell wall cluster transcriptional repressor MraZ [Candidatus Omnitrophota bacterium]